jgi:hypothetical protein
MVQDAKVANILNHFELGSCNHFEFIIEDSFLLSLLTSCSWVSSTLVIWFPVHDHCIFEDDVSIKVAKENFDVFKIQVKV